MGKELAAIAILAISILVFAILLISGIVEEARYDK